MSLSSVIGRLIGLSQLESIETIGLRWNANWMVGGGGWLFFALLIVVGLVVFFYTRQSLGQRRLARVLLPVARSLALVGLVVILAQPVIVMKVRHAVRPYLWFVIDDTASMAIRDEIASQEDKTEQFREPANPNSTGVPGVFGNAQEVSRTEKVKEVLFGRGEKTLAELAKFYRLRFFAMRRIDGLDLLPQSDSLDAASLNSLRDELKASGDMTALGAALADVLRRKAGVQLAGIALVSDFNHNSGPPPEVFASRLDVPIFSIGVGRPESQDVAVDLQLPPFMKKNERSALTVVLRQQGFAGEQVQLRVSVQRPGQPPSEKGPAVPKSPSTSGGEELSTSSGNDGSLILERTVNLTDRVVTIEVPFTPAETGQHLFVAEADVLPTEKLPQNNRVTRDTFVREYFVRVLFIEDEPTWEWRFMREVFHRDPLVGPEGFRTYLRSADPQVRERNPLFVKSLAIPRRDFFTNDVIILGDIPVSAMSPATAEMIQEFVNDMGGGLVFCVGARYGPGQWTETPLGQLLPVEVPPLTRLRETTFAPQLTAEASLFDFMRLGESQEESAKAWNNLGKLAWYYPVQRVRPLATVLACHPYDTCLDGKTRQPLIALQKVGRGEVVYIGTNEMWRLRRKFGEKYYRQFWGQMIHRLAIQHALGAEKRFVVRSDHREYRTGDEAVITVEAYDADFHPLDAAQLSESWLVGTLFVPTESQHQVREIKLTQTRPGWFETRIPLYNAGEYRLVVKDPLANQEVETRFVVSHQSVEFQQPTRNVERQRLLAQLTGGKSYELSEWTNLLTDLPQEPRTETVIRELEIWNTWPFFIFVVGLLLCEWFLRKWLNLR
ncbi:MAG: hypothetical protein WBH86_03645 [Thermogutta sp.]